MINQPLIDYIIQQQGAGTPKETIEASLSSQGWSKQDIDEGLDFVKNSENGDTQVESLWVKSIPKSNNIMLGLYLILVFGLDGFIVINATGLISFWLIMLGVLATFLCFYVFENVYLKKRFSKYHVSIDKNISRIIEFRNFVFLLNFIPFIQLIGMALIVYIGWVIVIAYIFMIRSRFKEVV